MLNAIFNVILLFYQLSRFTKLSVRGLWMCLKSRWLR